MVASPALRSAAARPAATADRHRHAGRRGRFRREQEGTGRLGKDPERLRHGRCRKAAGGGRGGGAGRGGGRAAGRGSSKMLPTTLVNSGSQGNGVLSRRDAARHTAGAKRYKYLRRLFHFRQMDFEFALWQMLYLFTSPQRVYRNFHYRKQTKDQWARDDPAFLVLLSIWLCVSTVGFGFVLDMGFFETIKLLLWVVFIDCVGVGLLIATLMWFISNKYLVKQQNRDYDVEWGYAFDVHLNAFYPLLVILHFIQLFFINYVIISDSVIGYFVGNTLWLIAIGYYIYVTFLGYSVLARSLSFKTG
ncbi:protein unc-50 homolog isoform X2 [Onychostruthus taczanowskii]|uniref:protein unc-50 homolog isoform X2 n=1 Tax=Onychostruthus taczanowskii TaxID=356909 RepID=UPI001B8034DE|nr:protein unc-50 homolog isoform X2 [Onychostruthus taczanowskii]